MVAKHVRWFLQSCVCHSLPVRTLLAILRFGMVHEHVSRSGFTLMFWGVVRS